MKLNFSQDIVHAYSSQQVVPTVAPLYSVTKRMFNYNRNVMGITFFV
jgi:hypothetical protein